MNRQQSVERAIRSHIRQAAAHAAKIQNPARYDAYWGDKEAREKKGLLRKWEKDMRRNAEQAEIEIAVWKERFNRNE